MGHIRIPSKFKKSSQYRKNLLGSSKILRQAKEQKKQKWEFLLFQKDKQKIESPLERLSKEFAFQWKIKQAFKGHFFIKNEKKQNNSLDCSKKLRKKNTELLARKTNSFKLSSESLSENKIKDTPTKRLQGNFNFEKQTGSLIGIEEKKKTIKILTSLQESRLDVNLYKAHFFSSISISRFFIKKGYVQVNKKKMTKPSKILKKNDLIQVSFFSKDLYNPNYTYNSTNNLKTQKEKNFNEGLFFHFQLFGAKNLHNEFNYKFSKLNSQTYGLHTLKFLTYSPGLDERHPSKNFNIVQFDRLSQMNSKIKSISYFNLLQKNYLYYTLFFQTSGLNFNFFFNNQILINNYLNLIPTQQGFEKKSILPYQIEQFNSKNYQIILFFRGKLSYKNSKLNILSMKAFLENLFINLPFSFTFNLLKK